MKNGFYQAALDIAEAKLFRDPVPTALLSPRLGTGGTFEDIFLWDTCFCAFWAQYHPERFPLEASLDNFYRCQDPDGFINRQIRTDGHGKWDPRHPIAFAPPLLPWQKVIRTTIWTTGTGGARSGVPSCTCFFADFGNTDSTKPPGGSRKSFIRRPNTSGRLPARSGRIICRKSATGNRAGSPAEISADGRHWPRSPSSGSFYREGTSLCHFGVSLTSGYSGEKLSEKMRHALAKRRKSSILTGFLFPGR